MDDSVIRAALRQRLSDQHAGEDALILDELGLLQGEARADLAVINGALNGYEIKSAKDTLARLPHQRDVYGLFFDTMTLVASVKHLEKAVSQIPDWWGILEAIDAEGAIQFKAIRESQVNQNVCAKSVVRLLWKSEAQQILSELGRVKGLNGKPRDTLWNLIAELLPCCDVKRIVRENLKARGDWRSAARRMSGDGLSRLVSTSLHSPVRQCHLHSHQCTYRPN